MVADVVLEDDELVIVVGMASVVSKTRVVVDGGAPVIVVVDDAGAPVIVVVVDVVVDIVIDDGASVIVVVVDIVIDDDASVIVVVFIVVDDVVVVVIVVDDVVVVVIVVDDVVVDVVVDVLVIGVDGSITALLEPLEDVNPTLKPTMRPTLIKMNIIIKTVISIFFFEFCDLILTIYKIILKIENSFISE